MLRIVTDGSADVPLAWQKEFDIHVTPANIMFGDHAFVQGVELDNDAFYRMVDQTHKIPKTSQPTPHQFISSYRQIAQQGDTVLSIHVTSKLSGTLAAAEIAAREVADYCKVITFDSLTGSVGIAMLCREARILERAGQSLEQILAQLEEMRSRIGIVLVLDTLEYARMSGRVGALQAALASILNVKPVAIVTNGAVNITEKVRTRRASLERLLEIVKEQVGDRCVNMSVVHAHDPSTGIELMERVRRMFTIKDLVLSDMSISVAANLGPGTIGIVFCPLE